MGRRHAGQVEEQALCVAKSNPERFRTLTATCNGPNSPKFGYGFAVDRSTARCAKRQCMEKHEAQELDMVTDASPCRNRSHGAAWYVSAVALTARLR